MKITDKKELIAYRKIGSVKTCRKAVQKQMPMEPRRTEWRGLFNHPYYECPICGRFVPYCKCDVRYCSYCGQALLWE